MATVLGVALVVPAFAADDNKTDLNQVTGVVTDVSTGRIQIKRPNHNKYLATKPEGVVVHVGDVVTVKGENDGTTIRTSHLTILSHVMPG